MLCFFRKKKNIVHFRVYFFLLLREETKYFLPNLLSFTLPKKTKKQSYPPCFFPAKKRLGGLKTSQLLFSFQKSKSISLPSFSLSPENEVLALSRYSLPLLSLEEREPILCFLVLPKRDALLFWNEKTVGRSLDLPIVFLEREPILRFLERESPYFVFWREHKERKTGA